MKKIVLVFFICSSAVFSLNIGKLLRSQTEALKCYKKDKFFSIEIMEESGVKELIESGIPKSLSKSQYVSILNDYAFYLSETERYNEAIPMLEKVLLLSPERAVAYLNLGDVYESNYTFEEDKSYLEKKEMMYKKYLLLLKNGAKVPNRVFERLLTKENCYKYRGYGYLEEDFEYEELSNNDLSILKAINIDKNIKGNFGLTLKNYFGYVPKIEWVENSSENIMFYVPDIGRIKQGIYGYSKSDNKVMEIANGILEKKRVFINSNNKKYFLVETHTVTGGQDYKWYILVDLEDLLYDEILYSENEYEI